MMHKMKHEIGLQMRFSRSEPTVLFLAALQPMQRSKLVPERDQSHSVINETKDRTDRCNSLFQLSERTRKFGVAARRNVPGSVPRASARLVEEVGKPWFGAVQVDQLLVV